jgi:hypothetical protein
VAHDDGAPGVEFVVGASADSPDEELSSPAPRRVNPRWALIGAAVVLGGAALIARGVSHGNEPGSPSPSAGGASSRTASIVAPESNRPIPNPRSIRFAAPLCQRPATCSLITTLPKYTVDALHAVFPGSTVRSSSTVLSTRADKMAPDIVQRTISARAGNATITVRISTAVPIDSPDVDQRRGVASTTRVTAVVLGYVVDVHVTRPGTPVSVTTVQRLAFDNRLILPV